MLSERVKTTLNQLSSKRCAAIFLIATGALLIAAGCAHSHPPKAVLPTPIAPAITVPATIPAVAQGNFVGSAVCADCHRALYTVQSHSRHALTLHLVSKQSLGNLAPPAGQIEGSPLLVVEQKNKFALSAVGRTDETASLTYALGSGRTGMTYVTPVNNDTLAEARMSYFPHYKKWYPTPGQEDLSGDVLGKMHFGEDGRRCLLCHAVSLPPASLTPKRSFFGVGCESCHGPASAHVAAMRAGKYNDLKMVHLADQPASQITEICGKCHGTLQQAQDRHLPESMSNRLQAYGLALSRCYQQSKDTLSCITCP